MSATVVLRHFGCTRKTTDCLQRRFRITGNVPDVLEVVGHVSPLLPMIVLQHLLDRRLIAAATGRQYGIHLQTVRNRLRQNVHSIRTY